MLHSDRARTQQRRGNRPGNTQTDRRATASAKATLRTSKCHSGSVRSIAVQCSMLLLCAGRLLGFGLLLPSLLACCSDLCVTQQAPRMSDSAKRQGPRCQASQGNAAGKVLRNLFTARGKTVFECGGQSSLHRQIKVDSRALTFDRLCRRSVPLVAIGVRTIDTRFTVNSVERCCKIAPSRRK